jgi:hypothetical protein
MCVETFKVEEILDSYSDGYEEHSHLGYDMLDIHLLTYQRNILPPSSGSKNMFNKQSACGLLAWLPFNPEEDSSMFVQMLLYV